MFLTFVTSGLLANWVLMYTGCLWTSAGIFGVMFGGMAPIMGTIVVILDAWDWF